MKITTVQSKVLFVLLIAFSPAYVQAGDFSVVVNGRSYHINSTYDWNENNLGAGVEYQFRQKSAWRKVVMANAFRDSMNQMSYVAGAGLHRRIYETEKLAGFYIYAGLSAFVMTREDVNRNKPFPGVLPSVTIGNRRMGLNVTYLPRQAVQATTSSEIVDPTISGIVFVQFKISLDQLLP